jgi:phosphoglycolate phosphatase
LSAEILFDAAIFDLDGTLVATETFWVAAAAAGAQRAFAELGIARELPSRAQWLSMVGLPIERAFDAVFPDLNADQRRAVMARCVEAEEAALQAGGAAPMPGALETLDLLRARGLKIGIASNCGTSYLEAMLDALALRGRIDAARCLESPGMRTKADMVADLLATFGTRAAVMVGDRAPDAEAARANAIPMVHVASALAPEGEKVECEAAIEHLGELPRVLGGRARWIESALDGLGCFDGSQRIRTLGITGRPAAGKSLFARDAARVLAMRGRASRVLTLDDFLLPGARDAARACGPSDDHLARAFDLDGLIGAVRDASADGSPRGAVVVVDGPFLIDPRLRAWLDRVVYLDAPEAAILARALARDGEAGLVRARREFLPAHVEHEAAHPPRERADLVLAAANPLGG